MKKTLALVLAIVMALGCMSITAFAADNEATVTAEITAADFGYTMVIPTATTLTEANHENVLLGTDGKVSIKDIKHPTDKVNVVYTVDLTNGNLTDGTNTINATYKYKQGGDFAAIDGTTKVTVYENATVKDSFVNVTANKDQWNAAPAGTYNATVVFNFAKEEVAALPASMTIADILATAESAIPSSITAAVVPDGAWKSGENSCFIEADEKLNFRSASEGMNTNIKIFDHGTPNEAQLTEGNYVYTNDTKTCTFVMQNGKLTAIIFSRSDNTSYNGTYTAPAAE